MDLVNNYRWLYDTNLTCDLFLVSKHLLLARFLCISLQIENYVFMITIRCTNRSSVQNLALPFSYRIFWQFHTFHLQYFFFFFFYLYRGVTILWLSLLVTPASKSSHFLNQLIKRHRHLAVTKPLIRIISQIRINIVTLLSIIVVIALWCRNCKVQYNCVQFGTFWYFIEV